jgi:hypothetical protein
METAPQRIAINSGSGYVPGLNAVVTGAVLAAARLELKSSVSVTVTTDCLMSNTIHGAGSYPDAAGRGESRPVAATFWAPRFAMTRSGTHDQ